MSGPDDDLERRLLNWARWKLAGGELSRSVIERAANTGFAFGDCRGGGYRETVMPILSGEAIETDAAVNTLQPEERAAVRGWYIGILPDGRRMAIPWTQGDLAQAMGYALRTFERLLADARLATATAILARRTGRRRP